jgi:hypothetical protein
MKTAYIFTILISFSTIGCGSSYVPAEPGQPAPDQGGQETTPGPNDPVPGPQQPGQWKALAKPSASNSETQVEDMCEALAVRAKNFGINRLIVAYEGLASYDSSGARAAYSHFDQDRNFKNSKNLARGGGGYVLHGLLKPLLEEARGTLEFLSLPHDSQGDGAGSVAEVCIRAWLATHRQTKLTIMGHSYGGHAANQLASALNRLGVTIDSVYTLDPRTRFYAGSFQRTPNAVVWQNFYQKGTPFLNGYVVPGADLNQLLTGVGHTSVPFVAEIFNRVSARLLGI